VFAFSGFKREVQAMAKQHRGRVKVLRHGKIKQTRIKEGGWSELCFLPFFFLFLFFFFFFFFFFF
jgi:hypothetical protein